MPVPSVAYSAGPEHARRMRFLGVFIEKRFGHHASVRRRYATRGPIPWTEVHGYHREVARLWALGFGLWARGLGRGNKCPGGKRHVRPHPGPLPQERGNIPPTH